MDLSKLLDTYFRLLLQILDVDYFLTYTIKK